MMFNEMAPFLRYRYQAGIGGLNEGWTNLNWVAQHKRKGVMHDDAFYCCIYVGKSCEENVSFHPLICWCWWCTAVAYAFGEVNVNVNCVACWCVDRPSTLLLTAVAVRAFVTALSVPGCTFSPFVFQDLVHIHCHQ